MDNYASMTKISNLLLETQALELAPAGKIFWYTSGTVGPFYLNAHFLYGGRKKAEHVLAFIDENSADRMRLLTGLLDQVERNYEEDSGYRAVIDAVVAIARDEIGTAQIDCISGGERRDWFFSLITAKRLQIPALVLFKDRSAVMLRGDKNNTAIRTQAAESLNGARILHVADLVTEASSYERTWLPAIQACGGRLQWAINVVDRGQGGAEVLAHHGITARHLVCVGPDFFQGLAVDGYCSRVSSQQLIEYHLEPHESMRRFLLEHPRVLREALRGDNAKIRQRAQQLIVRNSYGFTEEFLAQFDRQ